MHSGKYHGFFVPPIDDGDCRPAAYSYRNDPNVPDFADDKPIIVFDGYCALCCGWAAFVLRHDRRRRFRLLTAQSELGRSLYVHYGLDPVEYETNVLIEGGVVRLKSEACIRMATGLGSLWRFAAILRLIPVRLRDGLYAVLARNRIRWFGKRDVCFVPGREDSDRFLA